MFYMYLLRSGDNIYIGYTSNLEERLKEHNYGKVESTRKFKPWKVAYYEAYLSETDARARERTLKNYGSTLGQLKKRIAGSLSI